VGARARLRGRKPGGLLRLQHALYDRLVYARIRARLGGRMRFFVSGGAPLNPEIAEFFIGSGVMVIEGYGLTETSPVLTVNRLDRNRPGTVGPPIANVEIRIAEDGEILARGPGVMQGYYRLPAETEQALAGGWFHTGDIGHLDPDGFLVITDRKKDLLVTAGGKNVAPQPIENALKNIRYVAEAVLLGDRRPYCVALIVPDFQQLEAWARYKRVPFATRAELLARPEVVQMYERRIADATHEFARYEKVKRFALLDHDFTIAEGELTPTLKVRRRIISEHYAATIESLYQDPEGAGEEPAPETPGGSP
jgi:long-chain acyl-CoA synthetase